jgi:hypothetical protein
MMTARRRPFSNSELWFFVIALTIGRLVQIAMIIFVIVLAFGWWRP